jgi:hypothetical protein
MQPMPCARFEAWKPYDTRRLTQGPVYVNDFLSAILYALEALNGSPSRTHLPPLRLLPVPNGDTLPIMGCRSDYRFDQLY